MMEIWAELAVGLLIILIVTIVFWVAFCLSLHLIVGLLNQIFNGGTD